MRVAMPLRKPVQITSTDWLKLIGIASFLVDHVGLFFIEDDDWWRLLGRLAAPIFFFLIGFARSRNIPLSWILWGIVLSGIDWWIDGGEEFALNILLNFVFLRLALRLVDRWAETPLRLGVFALIALLLLPVAGEVFEYGAEGWLWALFGFAQRAFRDGRAGFAKPRFIFASVAGIAYVILEINDHDFYDHEAVALGFVILSVMVALLRFDRTVSTPPLPRPIALSLVWIAHYSLEIYAISLFLMQDVFYVFP